MDKNKLLVYFGILLMGLSITFFLAKAQFNPQTTGFLIFLLVFIPTLINPDIGLVIIIVSMLFSPEVVMGSTSARGVTVRIEDLFLLVVILAFFIRTAMTKDVREVFKTKLTACFFMYYAFCALSTAIVSLSADIDLKLSFFTILKYLEYFLLFLMVKENMRSLGQAKIFILIFLLTAFFVSIHAHQYIEQQTLAGVRYFRAAPPVPKVGGDEPGTLGGYLLFMIAIVAGLLVYARPLHIRALLAILLLLMFRGFLYTLSRGSYLAFIPMLASFVFFSKKFNLIYLVIAVLLLVAVFMPTMVRDRITQTLTVQQSVEGSALKWEDSPQARLESWKTVLFERFPRSPIIGHGIGKYFIDSQLFLVLCESGLVGLFLFLRALFRFFKTTKEALGEILAREDKFSRGLAVGFMSGFVGLLIQAISTNTFIIIIVMEPFWFMAGIVLSLPRLLGEQEASAQVALATVG